MQNPPNQEWIAPGLAAQIAHLSVQQLGRLADDGKIAFIRPGKHRRYLRADVESLVQPSKAVMR